VLKKKEKPWESTTSYCFPVYPPNPSKLQADSQVERIVWFLVLQKRVKKWGEKISSQ